MIKSFVELIFAKIKQYQDIVFMVVIYVLVACCVFWVVQDEQAGHRVLQPALVVEKIYRPAEDDSILVPVGSPETWMTIDASTPAQYVIKLALQDKETVVEPEFVRVKKSLFKTLQQGQSVRFDRWVGQSGIVYCKDVLPIAPNPTCQTNT